MANLDEIMKYKLYHLFRWMEKLIFPCYSNKGNNIGFNKSQRRRGWFTLYLFTPVLIRQSISNINNVKCAKIICGVGLLQDFDYNFLLQKRICLDSLTNQSVEHTY